MIKNKFAALLAGAAVLALALPLAAPAATPPSPASVPRAACNGTAYNYAEQATGYTTQVGHTGCFLGSFYQGWLGIDGAITTPTSTASLANGDHANGWLGMEHFTASNVNDAWIQIGWYNGSLRDGCGRRGTGDYGLYVESQDLAGHYHCHVLSNLGRGGVVVYRVEYVGNGCWNAYYNYSVFGGQQCGLPSAMTAMAVNELYTPSGNHTAMPQSNFGWASAGTNSTLRIKGAAGWRDWNTGVDTMISDNRYESSYPQKTVWSSYSPYYHDYSGV